MISIKRISAMGAIVCGVLFTMVALLSIWQVGPFGDLGNNYMSGKLVPSFALLTAAFIVLLVILRVMEEKN